VLTAGYVTLAAKDSLVTISASDGPSLQLRGKDGFETDLGVTSLVTITTGESHTTSAASIVVFGKDKKVLWSAP
jgi:hypothetical protein